MNPLPYPRQSRRKTTNRLRAIETSRQTSVPEGTVTVARQLIAFGRLKLNHALVGGHCGLEVARQLIAFGRLKLDEAQQQVAVGLVARQLIAFGRLKQIADGEGVGVVGGRKTTNRLRAIETTGKRT